MVVEEVVTHGFFWKIIISEETGGNGIFCDVFKDNCKNLGLRAWVIILGGIQLILLLPM